METKFELGQKVRITQAERNGQVRGIWHDINGATQYSVRYFDNNGGICDVWLKPDEMVVV